MALPTSRLSWSATAAADDVESLPLDARGRRRDASSGDDDEDALAAVFFLFLDYGGACGHLVHDKSVEF